jgi:ubiquinone/menaquinone biosynthesis C-methylase UbiE
VTGQRPSPDFPEFTPRTTEVWDKLAGWWDDKIGDGNATQDLLVEPAQERLLGLKPGELVLDIACGAGRFTRRMAAQGARIVAFDHSEKFVERAHKRTVEHRDRIMYRVMNGTDRAALLSLGERRFDAAVCTMALMDMAEIEPLISTLPRLLKPGGRFVWSVTHPVFNSGDAILIAEAEEEGTSLVTKYRIKLGDYLTSRVVMGSGMDGQPEQHHYFHRPVSVLFNLCFKHGFVLDGFEEPAFPVGTPSRSGQGLSWANFNAIPQVLVARMRLAAG